MEAVAFRQRFGLRADRLWVRAVAADPAAQIGIPEFGLPLMPDEFADLMDRHWDPDLLAQVRSYGQLFPEDFAGAWINLKGSGVTIAFKNRVDRHRTALRHLVPDGSMVEVTQVDWNLGDLETFATRVEAEQAWFESLGVSFEVDQEQLENDIRVRFNGPREAAGQIEQHFGNPPWLRAVWAGPPPWEGPRADLTIKVADANGQPARHVRCTFSPVDPMIDAYSEDIWGTGDDGICVLKNLPATLYDIRLYRWVDNDHYDQSPALTFRTTLEPGGTTTRVVIPGP